MSHFQAPPHPDHDPIYDHTNGTKNSVTTSAIIITPPAGCRFVRIDTDADIVVNTAGAAAVDNGSAATIRAVSSPTSIPVTAGVAVYALSLSGTAVVRCMPYKQRS